MISYFDLLQMIRDGNIPDKIIAHLTADTSAVYVADYDCDEFSCYVLENRFAEDENYRSYLSESLLEMTMFDDCIEIVNDVDPEGIALLEDDATLDQVKDRVNQIITFLRNKY